MNVFIVYPFYALTRADYQRLVTMIRITGNHLVTRDREDFTLATCKPVYNLSEDLLCIKEADLVVFTDNWKKDKECVLLHSLCISWEKTVTTESRLSKILRMC